MQLTFLDDYSRSFSLVAKCAFLLTILAAGLRSSLADSPYLIQEIGLTGSIYGGASAGALNANGQVAGFTVRQGTNNANLGRDEWEYTGTTTQQVGLTGGNYSYATSGGTYEFSSNGSSAFQQASPIYLNSEGEFVGYSNRYNSSGTSLGEDAWVFDGQTQQIGFTGGIYSYSASGGTYEFSSAVDINDSGEVAGYSDRYTSTGGSLGSDTWIYNGMTTQQVGLTGGVYYTATRQGAVTESSELMQGESYGSVINDSGQLVGVSTRYSAALNGLTEGQDAWIWNGATSTQIGLTGTGFTATGAGVSYESSTPIEINEAGDVMGTSQDVESTGSSLGDDAWVYNGKTTQLIGLAGPAYTFVNGGGTYHYAGVVAMNNSGQVTGVSSRSITNTGNTNGGDSWFFNGSTTQIIGLNSPLYSSYIPINSGPEFISNTGYVVGIVQRVNFQSLGQDAWFFNGTNTVQIGLIGGSYGNSTEWPTYGLVEYSQPTGLNDAGQVIGYSTLYNNFDAQDGWFYDSATNTTDTLRFSVDSATGSSFTDPELLTANGDVFGQYTLYSGSTSLGNRAFFWSPSAGFDDLGGLVSSGLNAQGWQDLANIYLESAGNGDGGLPEFLVGNGDIIGQTGGNSLYIMSLTTVPEPSAMAALVPIGLLFVGMGRGCYRREMKLGRR